MPFAPARVILGAMFALGPYMRPLVRAWLCCCLSSVVGCDENIIAQRRDEPTGAGSGIDLPADDMVPAERADGGVERPPVPAPLALVPTPLADAFIPLIDDVLAQPEEARPYLRYVLASRGESALDGEQERLALHRLVNSASLSPVAVAPVFVPELGVYRIDLRDYLWNRPVDVGPLTFQDGWEAIIAQSGLVLPALPEERLAALTGTATASLPARVFLPVAASGRVYYGLTGAPGFERDLQERLEARLPEPEVDPVYNMVLGAEAQHRYQGARRLLLPDGSGYWQGLPNTPRGNSLIADPFGFNSWETDAIYPLPNGFPAFFIDTAYWVQSPAPLTGVPSGMVMAELLSDCIACHSTGPVTGRDIYPDYVRENALYFDSQSIADIERLWPTQAALDAIIAADAAAYARVLEGAGLNVESANALQSVTRRHAAGLDVSTMAAALHASEEQVRAALPGITTIDAESFALQFRALLCRIHPDTSAAPDYCG